MRKFLLALAPGLALVAAPLTGQSSGAPATVAAEAIPPKIPASKFAKTSGTSGFRVSPDGNMIALRTVHEGKVGVALLDAETKQLVQKIGIPDKATLEWYRWAGSTRLLLSVSNPVILFGEEYKSTRVMVFDRTRQAISEVRIREMGLMADDVIYTDPAGQYVLLSVQKSIYEYPSVFRIPLDGTAPKGVTMVQAPRNGVWSWFADSSGVVRMGFEVTSSNKLSILYRKNPNEGLKVIAKLAEDSPDEQLWDVLRIVEGSDDGYVLQPDASGRVALRKFNYATRTAGETVFAVPGWDVTEADLDEKSLPVAAYFTDERDRVEWFDPKLKALQARLNRALKGDDVWIASRSKDNSRVIVWAGHEGDAGGHYLYSAARGTLDPFSISLPELDPAALVKPKPIRYTARDKTEIRGYLALPRGRAAKNLPLVVLPHGGPYGVRDKLEFDTTVQFLANRGYAVLQPNYRGSGGFGEAFDELGRGQIGRAMQDDIDDAMDWAIAQGIADPKRVCMMGSSYGGYASLWAVIRNPERYRCAVSFAGVTDWKKQLKYDANFFTRKGAKKWRSRVQGEDTFDLDLVAPALQVQRLTRPVLLAHGELDSTVPFKQYKAMRDNAAKTKVPIEALVFADEGHGFDKPENLTKWLEAVDAFLAKHNPAS